MDLEMCRLCRTTSACLHLFENNIEKYDDIPLPTKVMLCTPLVITIQDNFSKFICLKCFSTVNKYFDFREMCLKNQLKFKEEYEKESFSAVVDIKSESLEEVECSQVKLSQISDNEDNSLVVYFYDESAQDNETIKHICVYCNKTFKSPSLLRYHTMVHTGEKPFKCEECGHKFRMLGQLKFHLKLHTGNSPYKCLTCGKVFLRPSDLIKHNRKHSGERPFKCEHCDRSFSQLTGLTNHMSLHTGTRPFKCSFCPKSFIQLVNKTKHERIHENGRKPFVCDVPHCGRSFIDLLEKELHRAGHDGGRPRKCDTCGIGFRTPSQLRDHIRKAHTNERPYSCKVCKKKFYEPHSLKLHSVTHTQMKPFKCEFCYKTFSQLGNYKRHKQNKHSGTLLTLPVLRDVPCVSESAAENAIIISDTITNDQLEITGLF